MGCECDHHSRLMCTNVGDKRIREKGNLLLIGSCMADRFPAIVEQFKNRDGGQAVLHICLEETHVNQAGFKIGSIIRYADVKHVTALTIDGSPHCVQLHYIIEDIKRHFTSDVEVSHFVVEKGKVHEVSSPAVKRSRHLSKIKL